MKKLLAAKAAFGIIPGGSEDVAIHEHGKENVYINSRYGFIKYALQHGYSLILAYTFGENDQFYSLSCLRPLNLWLVKRFLDVFLMGGTVAPGASQSYSTYVYSFLLLLYVQFSTHNDAFTSIFLSFTSQSELLTSTHDSLVRFWLRAANLLGQDLLSTTAERWWFEHHLWQGYPPSNYPRSNF